MIVNGNKIRLAFTDILMLILSVVFFAGIRTWFSVCETMGDTVMSCHWAGEAAKAGSWVILAASLLHIFVPFTAFKCGVSAALLPFSIYMLNIVGNIIRICKSEMMSCRSHTQPWTVILMSALAVVAVIDIVFYAANERNKRHSRAENGVKK